MKRIEGTQGMSALFSRLLFGFVLILLGVAQRLFVIDLPIVVVNSFLLQWGET